MDLFWQDLFKAPSNYAYSFLDKENNGKTIERLWDCGSSFYIRGAPLSYKLHESVFIRADLKLALTVRQMSFKIVLDLRIPIALTKS